MLLHYAATFILTGLRASLLSFYFDRVKVSLRIVYFDRASLCIL